MVSKVFPVGGAQPDIESVDQSMLIQVFDRMALPTFVLDKNHVILHWNSALEKLSGLTREEMIGTRDQWRPFYASPRPCLADLILTGGKHDDVKHYYTNKCVPSELIEDAYEGEDFFTDCGESGAWLHFTAAGILGSHGELIGAIETLEDISARKKAELELRERERIYKELSITDSLTGLHNSRHFYDQLEQAIESTLRYGHGFTVCFFDLDNFKHLNDNYGHLMGDRVLETFGSIIKSSLRSLDSGYRYGGEEFAILLPSTDLEGAVIVAERIRENLAAYQFILECGDTISSTVSIGVTAYQVGDDPKSIMQRADGALYEAKHRGKNRVMGV